MTLRPISRPRILLTAPNGQVGWELRRSLCVLGDLVVVGHDQLDLADVRAIRQCVQDARPDWIINAAAYTAVDRAEQEPALAHQINAVAPMVLAEEAQKIGARVIHYSTDYVFAGDRQQPYVEEFPTGPLSVYGQTKLAGEQAVVDCAPTSTVFRTSWVYGARGKNFLLTMLRLANERPQLSVVADQFGAPTWSRMIAEATAIYVRAQLSAESASGGVFHLTATGQTSWHEFASCIIAGGAERGLCPSVPVSAITTADYPTPAKRPAYSMLSTDKLFANCGIRLPNWQESLSHCLDDLAAGKLRAT